MRIGRERADLVLDDKRVSAVHAEIEVDARGYRLRDLGSKNGTFVSGVRVLDAYLPRDATIDVGDDRIRFVRSNDIRTPERMRDTCLEHLAILAAVRHGDTAKAIDLVRRNIETGRASVKSALKDALVRVHEQLG